MPHGWREIIIDAHDFLTHVKHAGRIVRPARARERFPAAGAEENIAGPPPFRYAARMTIRAFLPLCVVLSACQSPAPSHPPIPTTLRQTGQTYADYAIEVTDKNKDGSITEAEWVGAGGTQKAFVFVDRNKDGRVTEAELVQAGSTQQFFDFVKRHIDTNKDQQLTPREFRTGAGFRALSFTF
jgi:hypothetical protein